MNAYRCPARGASPRRVYWERRLPRVYEKSARPALPVDTGTGEQRSGRPALPGLFTDPGRRSRCIMAFLALLMCLGVWLAPAGRIADAAGPATTPPTTSDFRLPTSDFRGPVTTPPALPSAGAQQIGAAAVATPPALPDGNPPRAAAGDQRRTAHGSSPDATPLHLPAYTPAGASPDTTLSGASLLGLLAKFVAVLVLLFIALRILRAVMPRLQGGGGWPDFRRHGPIQRSARR